MKLIDREHGGGRVIDGGGERLDRDVDKDSNGKERVLFHRALRTEDDAVLQQLVIGRRRAATQEEERFALSDKIAHLRRELDDAIDLLRLLHQTWQVHGKDDGRSTAVQERPLDRWYFLRHRDGHRFGRGFFRIDTL